MKTISAIAAAAVAASTLFAAPVLAQPEPAQSLSELLTRLQRETRQQSAEARQREQEFQNRADEQARLLAEAEAELEALLAEGQRLEEQFQENDARIIELDAELLEKQGDFGELFGVAKQSASELRALVNASVISAQYPGRGDEVGLVADTRRLPTRTQLDSIWKTYLTEMIHQRDVVTYTAEVIDTRGEARETEVTRLGAFNQWTNLGGLKFVNYDAGAPMKVIARAPAGALVDAARSVSRANPDRVVRGPIDPSRGELLNLVTETPTLGERIQQGGVPGYIIILLLLLSGAFGILRLVQLTLVNMAVRGQMGSTTPKKGNPLGRLMLAAADARRDGKGGQEAFELKLDEAIMRETSGLDFGLNFLKLAAAIAPLLGLLGTVVGMIVTFQQITLFGAGDPQIMAGGISQALVTTVLGLVAALPLLLIHSFAASASRAVQQVIEEQGAALAAEYAESGATSA